MKIKRRDVENVYEDFCDMSLSSPPRKTRRLDPELPPIMEEDETVIIPEQPSTSIPLNQERALVLYKALDTSPRLPSTPSNVSITLIQDLIPPLTNEIFWYGHPDFLKAANGQSDPKDNNENAVQNDCLAVIPWVPCQLPSAFGVDTPVPEVLEPMETEDGEVVTMEIEEDINVSASQELAGNVSGSSEVLSQWQKQHCITTQLTPNTSATPIMWP